MQREPVQTRTTTIRYGEDGILYITLLPGAQEILADAQENVRVMMRLSGERRTPLLIDIRTIKSQSREARDYYNSPEALRITAAMALLVGSRISSLIANFFISISAREGTCPMRIFTDEAEAQAWLKGFLR
ncbi:hypothetical protein K2Z83_00230 [Oscillochloris sp. ZM17-4]|uniref:DUF7793 family protein n=1 Tax=Oscillochloris sp. ZM17-4 TaxID=2866714 RepID=UPI001C7308CC|nr:hypothetical protein [Oscillochloris sp. ZM17-4]MBX0326120.1 hypothetical protein [Oscillochloris sp. ZM17-4]